jgi:hypothetical protein
MDHRDLSTLEEMQRLIHQPIRRGMLLADLAEQLLQKRDTLVLADDQWYDSLTGFIATLDSASTFEAKNMVEQHQLNSAIELSLSGINQLIGEKLIFATD